MSVGTKSAYSYVRFYTDPVTGLRINSERKPFGYRDYRDNKVHHVVSGDTLYSLAALYFHGVTKRAAGLWWIIMDFQPVPIHDPTLKLVPGTKLFIPSVRTVIENIFDEQRVGES